MKLYATTTSERGKAVGKGGNEYIETMYQVLTEKGREVFAFIQLRKNKDTFELILDNSKVIKSGKTDFFPKAKQRKEETRCPRCNDSKKENSYCFKCGK